jgi:hypothetical protein
MTGEFETSRDRRILAAFLIPVVEHVARSKDSSRGNDGFDHVRAIEACLIVFGAVRESKRQEAAFSNFVVHGRWDPHPGPQR